MRTAYFCAPYTCTWATPGTMEMRCAICVSPYSSRSLSGIVSEVRARKKTGVSAGLTLLYDGGVGIFGGSCRAAAAMADCTSCAAASMLRLRLNCRVTEVDPRYEADVMESRPAIVENCRSNGVATEAAIVSGLAPGSDALTLIVGKSTFGRSLTGSFR